MYNYIFFIFHFLFFIQMAKMICNNENTSYMLCLCMISSLHFDSFKVLFPELSRKKMCSCSDKVNAIVCFSVKKKISVLFGISKKTLTILNLSESILYRCNL